MPEPDAPTPAAATPPPSWLQTLLSNHIAVLALGGALGGAVQPMMTYFEAWRKDVAVRELALVQEQEALWRRNLDCLSQGSTWEVDGPRGLIVRITICRGTGDALLRYFANEWSPSYKWVRAPAAEKTP